MLALRFALNGYCRRDEIAASLSTYLTSCCRGRARRVWGSFGEPRGHVASEAAEVMELMKTHLRSIELAQIETQMASLEKSQKEVKP
jgi:hypothetical protein